MGVNIYYLELMFILLNISQPWMLTKKVLLTETLFLRRKDKKYQKKKLCRKFIRINTSKEGYNADYEASRIKTFISNLKNRKLKKNKIEKEPSKKIKEPVDK